jgi:hypothetical protein
MNSFLKWCVLKGRQINNVLMGNNERVTWSSKDQKDIDEICAFLDTLAMPTHEYNEKVDQYEKNDRNTKEH